MAINLTALSTAVSAANALNGMILNTKDVLSATPKIHGYQPQNSVNPDGTKNLQVPAKTLLFHYEGEQTLQLKSDITDHYIEDNTAIQDHIALPPVTITTHGFIGELNNVPPAALALVKEAADKLTIIGAYVPVLSITALEAYNTAFQAYQIASIANNLLPQSFGTGSTQQTLQQQYYSQFYSYWSSRTLFTVETPWALYENMAIESLRAVQDADSRMITDFEVTFKQIRFSSTTFITGGVNAARFNNQAQSVPTNLGTGSQGAFTQTISPAAF